MSYLSEDPVLVNDLKEETVCPESEVTDTHFLQIDVTFNVLIRTDRSAWNISLMPASVLEMNYYNDGGIQLKCGSQSCRSAGFLKFRKNKLEHELTHIGKTENCLIFCITRKKNLL